ncbi:FxSxx-COOH system tetratricopeptide repeat protein [Streptomyces aquilus]|uniref:FxSxx-COOH system tetratricopeptide repeat protein n=1 Tax=Streptomyces aquilus TaxID=2548456 RepID=UPI0036962BEF
MGVRVFISHSNVDRPWAEWAAWQLTDAGCSAVLDLDDRNPGDSGRVADIVHTAAADGTVLLLLTASRRLSASDLRAIRRSDCPIVPVCLDTARPPAELADLKRVVLADLAADEARLELVQAVLAAESSAPGRGKLTHPTAQRRLRRFGLAGPRLPGDPPRVWNLPPRNPGFTGRNDSLVQLRGALMDASRVVITGEPGAGKTQLALEYAHRFAGEYELGGWIRSDLASEHLAELAVQTGAVPPDAPVGEAVDALKAELRTRSRWLLILDAVEDPAALDRVLPEGSGHVLVTSNAPHWGNTARTFDLGAFGRTESIALLRSKVPSLTQAECEQLAVALDDFPLALVQAAGALRDEGTRGGRIGVPEYLRRLSAIESSEDHRGPTSSRLFASIRLSLDQLRREESSATTRLLFACALLAPAPFPFHAVPREPWAAPKALFGVLPDADELSGALDALQAHGLVRLRNGSLLLHPRTQSVVRDLLSDDDIAEAARCAEALLVATVPESTDDAKNRRRWTELLPHLLAVEPRGLTTDEGRSALCEACEILIQRGDPASARDRLRGLDAEWGESLGPTNRLTVRARLSLARALHATDQPEEAVEVVESLLERTQRVLGEDHPYALAAAAELVVQLAALGRHDASRNLARAALPRLRRVEGSDHPLSLSMAEILAFDLMILGEWQEARSVVEDVLVRRRRTVGEDDSATLRAATLLAAVLAALGETEHARQLTEETRSLAEGLPESETIRVLGRLTEGLDREATAALFQPAGEPPRKESSGGPAFPSVLVSHAQADEHWATWVAAQLVNSGHRVQLRRTLPEAGNAQLTRAFKEADVVLTVLSREHFLLSDDWQESEWTRLALMDHVEQRRFVALFVEPVDPESLPRALRDLVTPPLAELDEEAAQLLLRYVMRRRGRTAPEHDFPGATAVPEPSADSVQARQLVRALERSPVLSSRTGLQNWLDLIGDDRYPRPLRLVSLRTELTGVVRGRMLEPGGLEDLAVALELLDDPDSAAVHEVRRIIDRIERSRDTR